MTINLTREQESRLQALLSRGAYQSVDEVVEAALAAVEQRTLPGFAGTPDELDSLLSGLMSGKLTEEEFWNSVSHQTDALLTEHKSANVREGSVSASRERRVVRQFRDYDGARAAPSKPST